MDSAKLRTVPELLARSGAEHGPRLALKMRGGLRLEKYTYQQLGEQVGRMAELLVERGIEKGDRVLLWAPNSPSWVIGFLGTLQIGAVAVPLDVRSALDFVKKVVEQTEPRLALLGRALIPSITPLGIPYLVAEDLPLELHGLEPLPGENSVQPQDLAEIMFTSGTTGIPKGVMLTHRNLAANVEMALALVPLGPNYRGLSILPLSHMFEQVVGLLVPLTSGAAVVYTPSRQPNVLLQTMRREKIQAMALVPQALSLLMRNMEREVEGRGWGGVWRWLHRLAPYLPLVARRWLFWPVHRYLGGHLEFLLSGGAGLPVETGQKWENLGTPILEGYGATEATALVTGNRLEKRKLGSVGQPAPGINLRIAEDGEILLQGESIFSGYWRNSEASLETLVDGWYHTGDLGQLDKDGFLHFRGRKKNLIVLPDGQKVHAEDVEEPLRGRNGIRDAVVVGLPKGERVEIHAVVLADDEQAVAESVGEANALLAPHQQIKGFTIWDGEDFPRTLTLKVKRYEVLRQLQGEVLEAAPMSAPSPVAPEMDLRGMVGQILAVPAESVSYSQRLVQDLGLDSLSLVELLCLIEEQTGVRLVEEQIPTQATVGDLESLVTQGGDGPSPTSGFSGWPLQLWAVGLRSLLQFLFTNPLLATVAGLRATSGERMEGIASPCALIANHTSHLDSFLVLKALPGSLRRKVAVAAAADYWFANPLLGFLAGLLYNAYPMVRRGSVRPSLEHSVDLIDRGWSILIFPEGTRSPDGQMQSFRTGIGLLAAETGISIVPMRISGAYEILPKGQWLPRRGPVQIKVGEAVSYPLSSDSMEVTRDLEERVKAL